MIQRLGKELREQTTAPQEPLRTPSAQPPVPSNTAQPDQPHKPAHTVRSTAQPPTTQPSSHRDPEKPVADLPAESTAKDSAPPSKGLETPRDVAAGGGEAPPKVIPTSDVVSSTPTASGSGVGRWLGGVGAILLLGGGAYAWTRSRRSHAASPLQRSHATSPHHKYARDEPKDQKKQGPVNQGKGEQPQQPTAPQKDKKKEEPKKVSKRYALLVGVGFRRSTEPKHDYDPDNPKKDDTKIKEFQYVVSSLGEIAGSLFHWGFEDNNVRQLPNSVATKQTILNELQKLVDKANDLPEGCVSCFVKIHLMGHTRLYQPPQPKKGGVKPPDTEVHHGLVTWDAHDKETDMMLNPTAETLLYDYELAHYVKQISDALTKRLEENGGKLVKKDTGILVQSDQCYAQEVVSQVVKIPLVYAGWSAAKNSKVTTPEAVEDGVMVSPYAVGFSSAFYGTPAEVTVDDAHQAAADLANKKSPDKERQGASYTKTPEPIKPAASVVK